MADLFPEDEFKVPDGTAAGLFPEDEFKVQDEVRPQFDSEMYDGFKFDSSEEDPDNEELDATEIYNQILYKDGDAEAGILNEGIEPQSDAMSQSDILFDQVTPGVQTPSTTDQVYVYVDKDGNREEIPRPDKAYFGIPDFLGFNQEATVGPAQTLKGGLKESGSSMAKMIAALRDKMTGSETLPEVSKGAQSFDTGGSITDALIADGIPALGSAFIPGSVAFTGIGALSKVTGAANKLKNSNRIVQFLASALKGGAAAIPAEIAATSTVSTDEGNFVFGDNAFFSGMVELGDSEADKLLEQRLNTFAEGMALGGVLSTGMKIAGGLGTLTWDLAIAPFVRLGGKEGGMEKAVYDQLADELGQITPDTSENERRVILQQVAKIVQNNKDIVLEDIKGLENSKFINLDEEGNSTIKRDTVGSYLAGESDSVARGNAQKIRAGEINTGSPIVKDAMDRPVRLADETITSEKEALREGQQGPWGAAPTRTETEVMDDASSTIVSKLRNQVDEAAGGFSAAKADFDAKVNAAFEDTDLQQAAKAAKLEKAFREGGFGDTVTDLGTQSGSDVVSGKRSTRTQIIDQLEKGYARDLNTKNAAYAEIDGGDIDAEALFEKFSSMPSEGITAAARNFERSDPVRSFLEQLQAVKVDEVDADGAVTKRLETSDEVEERFKSWLLDNTDFGFFYQKIRPELAQLASDAFDSAGGSGLGRYYRDLIKYIDDDMVRHVRQADPDLAEAADNAKAEYKKFAGTWLQPNTPLEKFARIWNGTLGRTPVNNQKSIISQTEQFRPSFEVQSEAQIAGALDSNLGAGTQNLAQGLARVGDPGLIADYYIIDTLQSFATEMRVGGLEGANFGDFTKRMMRYAEQLEGLRETSPEMAAKVDSINLFIYRLEDASVSQEAMEKIIDNSAEVAGETLKGIQSSVLNRFLNEELSPSVRTMLLGSQGAVKTSDPEAAFKSVFTQKSKGKNEAPARVAELMQYINNAPELERPIILKGLKMAYNRHLEDTVFAVSEELGGVRPARPKGIQDGLTGRSQLFDIGDMIYADKPEFMQYMRASLDAAERASQEASATPIKGQSSTAFSQDAATATTRLIYTFVGALSRTGAKLRAGASAVIERAAPDERAAAIRTKLLADPDYFLALADKYNKDPRDPLLADLLTNYFSSAIVKVDLDTETEDGMPEWLKSMQSELGEMGEAAASLSGANPN